MTQREFGTRFYKLMLARQWNQSDLARYADLPRASISVYIRGESLPTRASLEKIAAAFSMEPEELWPNAGRSKADDNRVSFVRVGLLPA